MLLHNYSGILLEAGADEAGRGCLAGPVVAAAVILPKAPTQDEMSEEEAMFYGIMNDSKQLSEKSRDLLRPIIERIAVAYAITFIDAQDIDKINILNASIKAMQESVLKLLPRPEYVIIDGNSPFIPKKGLAKEGGKPFDQSDVEFLHSITTQSIVKGDAKYMSIAAASILAKTYRDEYMRKLHLDFPVYNWQQNKGYPTLSHRAAICSYGITPHHRKSFRM